jgi:hypothetical protein
MTLVALRTAIVSSIEVNVSAFNQVEEHGGSFNKQELQRCATKAPACFVAVLGGPVTRDSTQAVIQANVGAFIVTRGSSGTKRDAAVLSLVESVVGLAVENKWAYAHAKAPTDIRVDNLYSGDIDAKGVALWSVSWSQQADVDIYDVDSLDDFHTTYFDHDLADRDGQVEAEGMVQLQGSFMAAYGQMNVTSSAATNCGTPDTYVKAAGTTELNLYSDVDMPTNNRLRHTGTVAKPFLSTASVSVDVDTSCKVTLAFAKNGTVDTDSEIEQEIVAGDPQAFSLKHLVSLDENDYLEVWVKASLAAGVTLTKANFVLAAT